MTINVKRTSVIAVAATVIITLASAGISAAAAQKPRALAAAPRITPTFLSDPVVQPIPVPPSVVLIEEEDQPPVTASSLNGLVSAQSQGELSRELNCLAGAIYFEAKSESLIGQLAVGRVVIARSKSGRFPNSYCGVVYQPSQFSFVRGGGMPPIARGSQQWRNAVAMAQIAHNGSWRSPAEGALYFHAARVSPGWRLARVARIENHVFYK
jgi:N-acetylmuramoyl-L-alanine amidase